MATWIFDNIAAQTCGSIAGATFRVEMTTQSIIDYVNSGTALTAPTWTSATACDGKVLSVGEIEYTANPEAGSIGAGTLKIGATNTTIYTDAILGAINFHDVLRSFNFADEVVHVRMSRKSGANWLVLYWGVIDPASVRIQHDNIDDPSSWYIELNAVDTVTLLERVPARSFFSNKLTHTAYDVVNGTSYVTFYGDDIPTNTTTGAYEVQSWYVSTSDRVTITITRPTRFIRLADILAALGEYIGLEAAINNGGTWSDFVTGRWYIAKGPTPEALTFDQLYIHAGWYDSVTSAYTQRGTFFHDPTATTDNPNYQPKTSFVTMGSPYDILKTICSSLGLQFGVRVNTSNQRYLYVADMSRAESPAITITNNSTIYDVQTVPYIKRITGVEVVSCDGENILRGTAGNESVKVDCVFTCLNCYRADEVSYIASTSKARPYVLSSTHMLALWGCDEAINTTPTTPASKGSISAVWSVCIIRPMQDGVGGSIDGFGYGASYDGSIAYPTSSGFSNKMAQVPAMALAHMTFSPFTVADDGLGRYRVLGEQIELKGKLSQVITLTQTNVTPEFLLTVTIGGDAVTYTIYSVTWNLFDDEFTMKGERRW